MRTVTMKELDAMLEAVDVVSATCVKLDRICDAVKKVSSEMYKSDLFGAVELLSKGNASMAEELDQAFRQFERAAYNFLGEGQRIGETRGECFSRICAMSQEELLTAPARNGLRLQL